MKRSYLSALLAAALVVLLAGCGGQAEAPVATPGPVETDDTIIAEAKVVPARNAALSFEVGGTVAEVLETHHPSTTNDRFLCLRQRIRSFAYSFLQTDSVFLCASAPLRPLR